MANSSIKSVNMLILMQPDLETAVTFYEEQLGLTKRFHLKDQWAEFELNGVSLGMCPIKVEDLPDRRTGFVFEVEDLLSFYNDNADHVTFMAEPVEAVHGIMVSFRDPGGNIIDLYQPTPEKVREFAKKAAQKEQGEHQHADSCCSDPDCQS